MTVQISEVQPNVQALLEATSLRREHSFPRESKICLECGRSMDCLADTRPSSPPQPDLQDLDVLLQSNYPPMSTAVLESLRRKRQETAEAITMAESQMARLRARITTLQAQKRDLQAALQKYKVVLSPVRRLPHDVLACLFDVFGQMEDSDLILKLTQDVRSPPWVLGQVCRAWRLSALSLPRLWTTFDLSRLLTCKAALRGETYGISIQLERCRGQPINVALGSLVTERDLAEKVLSALCPKPNHCLSSPWSQVSLNIEPNTIQLFRPYTGCFQGLQELHLVGVDPEDHFAASENFDVFQDAPDLRTLSIWGENDHVGSLKLPWHQITRYMARDSDDFYIANTFHFTMLPRLENLQVCWLDCVILLDDLSPPPSSPILLPLLHTLILSSASPVWGSQFETVGLTQLLECITLPALRTLKYRNGLRESADSLLRLIGRSGCSLQDLTLFDLMEDDGQEVVKLIQSGSLHAVENLFIASRDYMVIPEGLKVPRSLIRTPEGKDNLPNLCCLRVNDWHGEFLDELIRVIDSRRTANMEGQHRTLDHLILQENTKRWYTASEATRMRVHAEEKLKGVCEGGLKLEWGEKGFPEMSE
ncbi:hypothetical protein V5O48_007067 [Marasmius crinis-equi]|uniref:F-box domain-containing protein n=1 Tax=Marasmius crinis-equi TaxID=585013 RepID=A0ABR3FHZ4_9AGAR